MTVVEIAAHMLSRITFVSNSRHFLHKQCDNCTHRARQLRYIALPERSAFVILAQAQNVTGANVSNCTTTTSTTTTTTTTIPQPPPLPPLPPPLPTTTTTTYLLTYLLTPWSRVLFEKLTGSAASQIPRNFGTRRFITVLTSASHLSIIYLFIYMYMGPGLA